MNIVSKLVSFFKFGTLTNSTPLPVNWYSTFAEAKAAAAQTTNKLVLVKVHADWCGYCKHFDQDIESTPFLSNYLSEHFVCARVKEGTGEGKKLKKAHKVAAYPAFLVFRGETFVGKVRGYANAPALVDALKTLLK